MQIKRGIPLQWQLVSSDALWILGICQGKLACFDVIRGLLGFLARSCNVVRLSLQIGYTIARVRGYLGLV